MKLIMPTKNLVLLPEETTLIAGLDDEQLAELRRIKKRGETLVLGYPSSKKHPGEFGILDQLVETGTSAEVVRIVRLPGGSMGATLQGVCPFRIEQLITKKNRNGKPGLVFGGGREIDVAQSPRSEKMRVLERVLRTNLNRLLKVSGSLDPEFVERLRQAQSTGIGSLGLCYILATQLAISLEDRLSILRATESVELLTVLTKALGEEFQLLRASHDLHQQTNKELTESRRRSFLMEKLRTIKAELGEADGTGQEADDLADELEDLPLPDPVRVAVDRELNRLELLAPGSPEYMVAFTYLGWIRDLPWDETEDVKGEVPTIADARRVLDRDHHGLEKVKERVLEFLAVWRHRRSHKGDILLLSGPPGVGKTSLATSIAEALGRPLSRITLGGVRDSAEIRGHRRTYIGAMPGKIITAIKQAGSRSAVILLDEIEKVGLEHGRGDMSSALLEVLDPEQNHQFVDHYLGVPFDLGRVVFIATCNDPHQIPPPLLDRMEHIPIPGYTELEKQAIARRHLVPRIRKKLAIRAGEYKVPAKVVSSIIERYTREAGVRNLERILNKLGRRVVLGKEVGDDLPIFDDANLPVILGAPKYLREPDHKELPIGVATGLAYTPVGGDILYIEARASKPQDGKGSLKLTGSLGKVMRESAQAALSFLVSVCDSEPRLGFTALDLNADIHLHFPDGGTPKDGPSAGIAILCALAGLLSKRGLSSDMVMTGEITLRGQVLAVGGIREKMLAAHRYGKKRVIVPGANRHDVEELPLEVKKDLEVIYVDTMVEVLSHAGIFESATVLRRTKTPEPKKRLRGATVHNKTPTTEVPRL